MKESLASLAATPVLNLVIVCGTVLVLVAIVALFLKNMGVVQFGSFTIKKEQEGQSINHSMDDENNDLDDLLKSRLRQMTNSLRNRIVNMFGGYDSCDVVPIALAAALRYPLYESIGNNHYTKELMPSSFSGYRQRMMMSLQDEYISIEKISKKTGCGSNRLPELDEVSQKIEQFLDIWLRDVVFHVRDCSEAKISVYKKYLEYYEFNKDAHRIKITEDCIAKNERYVLELNERYQKLCIDIRQREEKL